MRFVHAVAVGFVVAVAVRLPLVGVDGAVAADWERLVAGPALLGPFATGFAAFAAVQLPLLALGARRGVRGGLVLVLAAALAFVGAVGLEAVRIGPAPLVPSPGAGFRAVNVLTSVLAAGAFLGLAEWGRRGAGVCGPLLVWVVGALSWLPADFGHILTYVSLGELSLLGLLVHGALAVLPVVVAGAVLAWRGLSPDLPLDGAPLGRGDAGLLVAALLVLPALTVPQLSAEPLTWPWAAAGVVAPQRTGLSPMVSWGRLLLTTGVALPLALWLSAGRRQR